MNKSFDKKNKKDLIEPPKRFVLYLCGTLITVVLGSFYIDVFGDLQKEKAKKIKCFFGIESQRHAQCQRIAVCTLIAMKRTKDYGITGMEEIINRHYGEKKLS